jgi:phytanoyl-CoA hydroxylase
MLIHNSPKPMLSPDQRQRFDRDGFLLLPAFKPPQTLAEVRARAEAIVREFEPDAATGVFSTRTPGLTADAALIASADAVHCFFEEEAFDAGGRLVVPKEQAINKIGHALHERDPVFERFSHGPELAALAADLGLAEPQIRQSMLIFKQPAIGGEVRWHQDATYFVTEPVSVTTFWFALEDADTANGCLWAEPGGHRGPLRERFVREGDALRHEVLDRTPWPGEGRALPLPVAAGTLVVFHGLLPHYSAPNRSARRRLAYTLHVTDGRTRYAPTNWLQHAAARGFRPAR